MAPPEPALVVPADVTALPLTPPGDVAAPPLVGAPPAPALPATTPFELHAPAHAANARKMAYETQKPGTATQRNRLIFSWINGDEPGNPSPVMRTGSVNRGPDWDLYAAHREKFTQTVLSLAPSTPNSAGRLCVLGAGKCNDLDLARLSQAYREVHLVDLDAAALASGVSREEPDVRNRLQPHAPVDLSVLSSKRASKWQRRSPTPAELEATAESTLQGLLARLPGPFDVVVSACVLTQLGFALNQSFSETNPLLSALRLCIVSTHLRTLCGLMAPGGTALFVSDLAASSHYPALTSLPTDAKLDEVLRDIVKARAFYQVARPDLISDLLSEIAEVEPRALPPWLWTGPQQRTYLVYGFTVSKSA